MKLLKRIGLGLLLLVGIALIAALFVDGKLAAERSIVIDRPVDQVYGYVKYLRNQDRYSKWARMDPDMKTFHTGTDGTVGFTAAWASDKDDVGQGEQTITALQEGRRVEHDIHFIQPFESRAASYMSTQAEGPGRTRVTWGFRSEMAYPLNLMNLFMDMNEAIGADFEEGLTNLKTELER